MYCSSCGAAVTQGLSYCNRCGAELSAKERSATKLSEVSPESLVWAIVAVSVGGLAILIGLIAVMKEAGLDVGLIIGFTALGFMLLLAAASVFIWMLLRSKSGAKEMGNTVQLKEQATKKLSPAQVHALPEPMPSVTENTTREFEPSYRERKTQ